MADHLHTPAARPQRRRPVPWPVQAGIIVVSILFGMIAGLIIAETRIDTAEPVDADTEEPDTSDVPPGLIPTP